MTDHTDPDLQVPEHDGFRSVEERELYRVIKGLIQALDAGKMAPSVRGTVRVALRFLQVQWRNRRQEFWVEALGPPEA